MSIRLPTNPDKPPLDRRQPDAPVLNDGPTVAAPLRAAAPCLLTGGTADRVWDGQLARWLTPHVLEIGGADHGMFVPGRLGWGRLAPSSTIERLAFHFTVFGLPCLLTPGQPQPRGHPCDDKGGEP